MLVGFRLPHWRAGGENGENWGALPPSMLQICPDRQEGGSKIDSTFSFQENPAIWP